MPALWIVEHLDVIEDILPGLGTCCVDLSTNALALDELKEAFSNSVVVAVTSAAHALLQIVGIEEIAPVIAAELTPLVRVHHHGILRLPAPDSHQQRIHRQLAVNA